MIGPEAASQIWSKADADQEEKLEIDASTKPVNLDYSLDVWRKR